ncbi:hypothetical protein OC842_002215 [Tilletia horrida]|uniref:Ubiquinone biosynthesis protein n=1 Tax=Tilletia horrida TaxID=155126 RepID=A0AAN6JSE1_9BASI|nr:hypothetical protein OC842_002215 [Tilletia horrida]
MAASTRSAALLRAALPHIPAHGFTLAALRAGIRANPSFTSASQASPAAEQIHRTSSGSNHEDEDAAERIVDAAERIVDAAAALFPGPPTARTSIERTLFSAWDRDASARAFDTVSNAGSSSTSAMAGPSASSQGAEAQQASAQTATALLRHRLALIEPVREHLLKAFALESAHPIPLPSLPSALQATVPLLRFLPQHPALPDPIPLLSRAGRIADEACRSTQTSRAWRESLDGPEWYLLRSRLALAYLVGELHLLSPSNSLASSQDLLVRVADGPSVLQSLHRAGSDLRSLIEWGGRSWIGILRSRGL